MSGAKSSVDGMAKKTIQSPNKRAGGKRHSQPITLFDQVDNPPFKRPLRMSNTQRVTETTLRPLGEDNGLPMAIAGVSPKRRSRHRRETAESMAAKQKEISVSEFFAKNRHLLGFDNPR